jgi:hypothetical protein
MVRPWSSGSWVYNGSLIVHNRFLAQMDGSIVSLVTDPVALINNVGPGHDNDMIWEPNPANLPPPTCRWRSRSLFWTLPRNPSSRSFPKQSAAIISANHEAWHSDARVRRRRWSRRRRFEKGKQDWRGHPRGQAAGAIKLLHDIPLGHKVAMRDLPKDKPVIKYGRPVGKAVAAIAKGAHVHMSTTSKP